MVGVDFFTIGRRTEAVGHRQLTAPRGVDAALTDAGLAGVRISTVASTLGGEPMSDAQMLGMGPLSWFASGMASPAFSHAAVYSIAAVASGQCETAMTTRIIQQQPTGEALLAMSAMSRANGVPGDMQFVAPFGAGSPTQWAGLLTQRHMAQYGTTEEQFGAHVIAQRHHAALNDDALFRDPLTIDDYLAARYVSKPVRILDCDYPVDSGAAVIFTTEERARDLKQKAVFVEAYALSAISDLSFENLAGHPGATTSPHHADLLVARTTTSTPADVDCAQLYDGFTIITVEWLEALGLCAEGEAGSFLASGATRLGGSMPVNTDGGACNVGRRHGANFCIEAVRQIRGQCGERQVPGAEVSVWIARSVPSRPPSS